MVESEAGMLDVPQRRSIILWRMKVDRHSAGAENEEGKIHLKRKVNIMDT
jgi:hypothetical protein